MRFNFRLLILLTLFNISCENKKTKKESEINSEIKTTSEIKKKTEKDKTNSLDNIDKKVNDIKEEQLSFPEFWIIFRKAIIENDQEKILKNTNFPFETRGTFDSDPIVRYDKTKFFIVLKIFLERWGGNSIEVYENQLDILKRISDVQIHSKEQKDYVIQDNYARVGDFEFRKIKEKWFFAFAYLDDESIEEINKRTTKQK